jgi:hypothetical protein
MVIGNSLFNKLIIGTLILVGIFYITIWNEAPYVEGDAVQYMDLADDLLDGKIDQLHFRTPGYPVLLILTNSVVDPKFSLFLVQLIMHLVSILFLTKILSELSVSRWFILLFIALALLPTTIGITLIVHTEPLAEFLLVLGTYCLLLWLKNENSIRFFPLLVFASLSYGVITLVRPTYQFLPFGITGLLGFILFNKKDEKKKYLWAIITIFTISSVIFVGYSIYNLRNYDFWGITPSLGIHLSTKTARLVERLPEEYSEIREILVEVRDKSLIKRHSSHTGSQYLWENLTLVQEKMGLSQLEFSNLMLELNIILIRKAPLEYLAEVARANIKFWFPNSNTYSNFNSRYFQFIWTFIHFIVVGIFFFITMFYSNFFVFLKLFSQKSQTFLLPKKFYKKYFLSFLAIPLFIVFYTMLITSIVDIGDPRQRAPVDLYIFFLVVLGMDYFVNINNQIKLSLDVT